MGAKLDIFFDFLSPRIQFRNPERKTVSFILQRASVTWSYDSMSCLSNRKSSASMDNSLIPRPEKGYVTVILIGNRKKLAYSIRFWVAAIAYGFSQRNQARSNLIQDSTKCSNACTSESNASLKPIWQSLSRETRPSAWMLFLRMQKALS